MRIRIQIQEHGNLPKLKTNLISFLLKRMWKIQIFVTVKSDQNADPESWSVFVGSLDPDPNWDKKLIRMRIHNTVQKGMLQLRPKKIVASQKRWKRFDFCSILIWHYYFMLYGNVFKLKTFIWLFKGWVLLFPSSRSCLCCPWRRRPSRPCK
jgi:hypothetical protein